MSNEEVENLKKAMDPLNPGGRVVLPAMATLVLPRLLAEREALLAALKVIVGRLDGDSGFVIPDDGAEMLHAAQAAIAKAES